MPVSLKQIEEKAQHLIYPATITYENNNELSHILLYYQHLGNLIYFILKFFNFYLFI